MNTWHQLACGALAVLFALAPAGAQEAHGPGHETAEAGPLGADPTADMVIEFFTLFSVDERIDAAIAPLIAQLTQPGEVEPGWQDGGIDILAELASAKGGAGAVLLRDTDREVLSASDLSGTVRPDLSRFDSYALRPEPVGLVDERGFTSFAPGVWFETAHQRVRRGNALCYSGYIGVTLHTARPVGQWDEEELAEVATMFALIDRLASLETCTVYDRREDGAYESRTYLPDGARLEALDAETTPVVAMPASELDAFLRKVPEPATQG